MGTTRQKNSCRNRLQNGPHSLLRMKVGTHSPLPTGSHTAAYTPKQGLFRMGALLLPSERFARFGNPAWPGVRTAYFAALGSWPGGALEERRKPSGQRCAYACRCPEGVAAPLGCVIFSVSVEIAACMPCSRYFFRFSRRYSLCRSCASCVSARSFSARSSMVFGRNRQDFLL